MKVAKNLIAYVILSCLFVLNSTPLSNAVLFVFFLILIIFSYKSINFHFSILKLPLLISIVISLIINVNLNNSLTENIRFVTLASLFLFFPFKIYIENKLAIVVLAGVGIYIFFLQIGAALGFSAIANIIENLYPIDKSSWSDGAVQSMQQLVRSNLSKRFGGIYYNPNIMGQVAILWFVLMNNFLDFGSFLPKTKKTISILSLLLTIVSILFSGSRTAMVVFLFFIGWNYSKVLIRNIHLILLPVIFLAIYFSNQILNIRIFSFSQGIYTTKGSVNIKLETLKNWMNNRFADDSQILHVLFGDLSWNAFFDADPGYVLNYFGFIGGLGILWYFFVLLKIYPKKFRANFSILLIGLGATVIFNFRFSILAFIIFSLPFNYDVSVDKNLADR